MVKAIIFDADGVLITAEMFGKQYSKDFGVENEVLLPFFKGKFQECLVGEADLKKVIVDYLSDWKWNKSVDELLKYWFEVENKIDKKLVNYIKNLKLQGIICCLGTNQEKYRTKFIAQEMGFNQIFDNIYSSSDIGYKKPQWEFFQNIVDTLSLEKGEILFWDNSSNHIESAKKFGFKAELYETYSDFEKKMKSYLNVS